MKIILTKGLPGSGKTTWAKGYQEVDANVVLINKDDLRGMLHQNKHSSGREAFVLEMRNAIVIRALQTGHDVIIHDTNFNPVHEAQMREITKLDIFAGKNIAVEIKDFTDVPLEECIKRDLKRCSSVGERVIRQMYNQYLRKPVEPVLRIAGVPDAIICDIDGTLANFGEANPYERDFSKDWGVASIMEIVETYAKKGVSILLVSGRMDKFEQVTREWLANHFIVFDELWMRKTEDVRKDVIIKQEIYNKHIKGKYNIKFVLDDRNQVVELWRSLGLTCLQVAEGDF